MHSSSGGLFELLFSGLSIPESEVGDILHLSEEDLQSFSVLTGMGYLNSVKGLVEKTVSEEISDVETEFLSFEISEKIPLFGLDLDTLELSLKARMRNHSLVWLILLPRLQLQDRAFNLSGLK